MKKALVFSARGLRSFSPEQIKFLRRYLDVRFFPCLKPLSPAHFIRLAKPYRVIGITRRTLYDLSAETINQLPNLRELAIYATGYEWVDAAFLLRKGVKLSYLPNYSSVSVAEHAMGCLLVLSRRIHLSFDKVRGLTPPGVSLRGWELAGKTLGLVGFGRIGRKTAKLAEAFGMRVILTDRKATRHPGQVSLRLLLGRSDAILLTSPKVRGTDAVLRKKELAWIKNGAVLVNVGRSDLVDHKAILPLLRNKKISGYAVDGNIELLKRAKGIEPGRILQTAHTAWYSNEAISRGTQTWVENLAAFGRERPQNLVHE